MLANFIKSQSYSVGSRLASAKLMGRGNLKCVFSGANNPTDIENLRRVKDVFRHFVALIQKLFRS